jgi:hypothetical protein
MPTNFSPIFDMALLQTAAISVWFVVLLANGFENARETFFLKIPKLLINEIENANSRMGQ